MPREGANPDLQGDNGAEAVTNTAFLSVLSAAMAALAKCDGHVDASEIEAIERAFRRLGLTPRQRAFCIARFRRRLAHPVTLQELLGEARYAPITRAAWEILYGFLWDVACADGHLKSVEAAFLREFAEALGDRLPPNAFERHRRERVHRAEGEERQAPPPPTPSPLEEAYALLQVSPDATDAEAKAAYRARVKQLHPDRLRAQGLPDALLPRANAIMAQVNAAWERVRHARNLS